MTGNNEASWLAVVGTREVDYQIRQDIEEYIGQKIADGYGIVSGGETGVDHEAARLAFAAGLSKEKFRIYLPIELGKYCVELIARSAEGKCRESDARETVELLTKINEDSPGVICDKTPFSRLDEESFQARNLQIIDLADELVAFRVDMSRGTTFTVEQARWLGMAVEVIDY